MQDFFSVTKLSLDYDNALHRRTFNLVVVNVAVVVVQTCLNAFEEKGNSLTSSDAGGPESVPLVVQPGRKEGEL